MTTCKKKYLLGACFVHVRTPPATSSVQSFNPKVIPVGMSQLDSFRKIIINNEKVLDSVA